MRVNLLIMLKTLQDAQEIAYVATGNRIRYFDDKELSQKLKQEDSDDKNTYEA